MHLDDLAGQLAALPPQLTEAHLQRAGLCVLDALACAHGGRRTPWVAQARAVTDGGSAATLWATDGQRSGLADAVFVNSVAAHSLLAEDTHAASRVHPGTVVVPVALGVGEVVGASREEVLHAVVLGYETLAQVAASTLTAGFVAGGWRATGVFGPFGAAAAAAHLLGLDEPTTVHALALAANSAAGTCEWAPAGTTEVYFQPATAARAGVVAALLARAGARGAASAIEGPFGLRRAFGGKEDGVVGPAVTVDRLAIEESFFKAHASCAFTQAAVDAAVRAHALGIDAGAVAEVAIHTSNAAATYPGCDNPTRFDTPIARQMSLQFAVAAALLDGRLEPGRYGGVVDGRLAALAGRSRVVVDPDHDRDLPARLGSRVELVLDTGEVLSVASGEQVDLPPAGVPDKFRALAADLLTCDEVVGLLTCTDDWTARELTAVL